MTVAEIIERLGPREGVRVAGVCIGGAEAPREIEPERVLGWMHLAEVAALDGDGETITIYYRGQTAGPSRKEAGADVPGGH